jgi:uncharacterized protein YegL
MSDSIIQTPAFGFQLSSSDFAENTDPRCPTVLILDNSGSMAGEPLEELQRGVEQYIDELASDPLAKRRVEVAIVTFGNSVEVAHPFASADQYAVPELEAAGLTPMGHAINIALDLLADRKAALASQGIPQYRSWVFLITDGGPTDETTTAWTYAIQRLKEGETKKSFLFFAVGIQGADFEKLNDLCGTRKPVALDGLRFRDLFQWLSASQKIVSQSNPGNQVDLPALTWGKISI